MLSGEQFVLSLRLGRGRSFTLAEIARATGKSGPTLNMILHRLKKKDWIIPFSRGFFLVPNEHSSGSPILDSGGIIDAWARHMEANYYVGGLSAAALHGAFDPSPTIRRAPDRQVFLDKRILSVDYDGGRFQTFYKNHIPELLLVDRRSPDGVFRLSGPELTAHDLVAYPACSPSLAVTAGILAELTESIQPTNLVMAFRRNARRSVLQRLGWLLELSGTRKAGLLNRMLQTRPLAWRPLDCRLPARGPRDPRWKIIVNADIRLWKVRAKF